jgi:flagellar motor component MotA
MMRYFARLLVLAMFGGAILMGGNFAMFINLPSLLIVLGGGLFVTLSFHSPTAVKNALVKGWVGATNSPDELKQYRNVLGTMRTSVVGSGILGTLIGLVQMLAHLDDPTKLGPAIALALLTLVYSVLLSELYLAPMSNGLLAEELKNSADASDPPAGPSGLLNISAVFSFIVSFTLLIVALY